MLKSDATPRTIQVECTNEQIRWAWARAEKFRKGICGLMLKKKIKKKKNKGHGISWEQWAWDTAEKFLYRQNRGFE